MKRRKSTLQVLVEFCRWLGLVLVPEQDHARDKHVIETLGRMVVEKNEAIDALARALAAERKDHAATRHETLQDLHELVDERDDWKGAAENRGAVIRVLIAAVQQGGYCGACGQKIELCPERCAARVAAESLVPVGGEAVAEA